MDFFNALPLDLKMLVVAIAGAALLAVFSGNRKNEKRYMLVVALLAIGAVYRFTHLPAAEPAERTAADGSKPQFVKVAPKHQPIVSTSAK